MDIFFVSDPLLYKNQFEALNQITPIKNADFVDTQMRLEDQVRWFKIETPETLDPSVLDLVHEIWLMPIELSIKISNQVDNWGTLVSNLSSFVKPLIDIHYHLEVDHIGTLIRTSTTHELIVTFVPYYHGRRLYTQNPGYLDLDSYLGFTFLTKDPLVSYVITNLNVDVDVRFTNGVFMLNVKHKEPWKDLILNSLINLKREGYFSLSTRDPDELNAYLELATFWGGSIKRTQSVRSSVILHNRINFDVNVESWYHVNAKRILSGGIPRYRFMVPEKTFRQTELNGIPNTAFGSGAIEGTGGSDITNKVKLKYLSTVAYLNLTVEYPELLNHTESIKIYNDMSIEAAFYSYDQVIRYKALMSINLSRDEIRSTLVDSIDDGILLRYKIEKLGTSGTSRTSGSMLVIQDDKIYVVTDIPVGVLTPGGIEKSDLIVEMQNKVSRILPKSNGDINQGLSQNIVGTEVPTVSAYGHFSNILLKGVTEYSKPVLREIKDVIIHKTKIEDGAISYHATIHHDDFLTKDGVHYLSDKEMVEYHRELSLGNNLDTSSNASTDIRWTLYEGLSEISEIGDIGDVKINEMWKQGSFLNEWQKYIYNKTNKFSRITPTYYTQ